MKKKSGVNILRQGWNLLRVKQLLCATLLGLKIFLRVNFLLKVIYFRCISVKNVGVNNCVSYMRIIFRACEIIRILFLMFSGGKSGDEYSVTFWAQHLCQMSCINIMHTINNENVVLTIISIDLLIQPRGLRRRTEELMGTSIRSLLGEKGRACRTPDGLNCSQANQ